MLALNIVILALMCHVAAGVRCYNCNATNNENCHANECNGKVCMKEVTTTFDERTKATTERVSKHCKSDGTVGCFKGQGTPSRISVWYCMCATDFCNGAQQSKVFSFGIGTLALIVALAVGSCWR